MFSDRCRTGAFYSIKSFSEENHMKDEKQKEIIRKYLEFHKKDLNELKPQACPCGQTTDYLTVKPDGFRAQIRCDRCGRAAPWKSSIEQAVTAWNEDRRGYDD
jgi:hypothetical protein